MWKCWACRREGEIPAPSTSSCSSAPTGICDGAPVLSLEGMSSLSLSIHISNDLATKTRRGGEGGGKKEKIYIFF